jgi:hypothetical protein
MANPTLSVTYNKAVYAPGETITATVAYADPDTKTVSDVWQATNANGDQATGSWVLRGDRLAAFRAVLDQASIPGR